MGLVSSNQRKSARYDIPIDAVMFDAELLKSSCIEILDLSRDGCRMKCADLWEEKDQVMLSIDPWLLEQGFDVVGSIVWRMVHNIYVREYGIHFTWPCPEVAGIIKAFSGQQVFAVV